MEERRKGNEETLVPDEKGRETLESNEKWDLQLRNPDYVVLGGSGINCLGTLAYSQHRSMDISMFEAPVYGRE